MENKSIDLALHWIHAQPSEAGKTCDTSISNKKGTRKLAAVLEPTHEVKSSHSVFWLSQLTILLPNVSNKSLYTSLTYTLCKDGGSKNTTKIRRNSDHYISRACK